MNQQTWLITGATGLIGTALCAELVARGCEVRALGRGTSHPEGTAAYTWSPIEGLFPEAALDGVDVVVHLAAASVGQRWTSRRKKEILESRVNSTRLLREALIKHRFSGTWIQASAIGIYGNQPDPCAETSPSGNGFLADVARAWEDSAKPVQTSDFRQIVMRLGLVLASNGGSLEKLLPIYKLGLGAPLGTGKQPMGWIHLQDVVRFIVWAAENPEASGAYNVVAPNATTNEEFSTTLAGVLHRPHIAPNVPSWILKIVLGEMSSLLLEGQNATPQCLLSAGFEWQHPDLHEALQHCI